MAGRSHQHRIRAPGPKSPAYQERRTTPPASNNCSTESATTCATDWPYPHSTNIGYEGVDSDDRGETNRQKEELKNGPKKKEQTNHIMANNVQRIK